MNRIWMCYRKKTKIKSILYVMVPRREFRSIGIGYSVEWLLSSHSSARWSWECVSEQQKRFSCNSKVLHCNYHPVRRTDLQRSVLYEHFVEESAKIIHDRMNLSVPPSCRSSRIVRHQMSCKPHSLWCCKLYWRDIRTFILCFSNSMVVFFPLFSFNKK